MKQYLVYFGRYVEVTHSPTPSVPNRYRSRQGDFFLTTSMRAGKIRGINLFDTRLEAIRYIFQLERSGYYLRRYKYRDVLRLPFDYSYCLRLIHRFYPEDFI